LPAGHAEQEIAPFTASVLVTLPGEQTAHDVWPSFEAYLPGEHNWHASVDEDELLPGLHGVHVEPPGEANELVALPGGHARHDVGPELLPLVMLE